MKLLRQTVSLFGVHGLRKTDIGTNGRTEEIKDPECCSYILDRILQK